MTAPRRAGVDEGPAGGVVAARTVAVLLAAGGAKRFGARKQLALLDGRPLVAHAVGALLASAVDEVVVVVGAGAGAVTEAVHAARPSADAPRSKTGARPAGGGLGPWRAAAHPAARLRTVECVAWADGMAASLRAGVAAAQAAGADRVLVALADQPRITAAVHDRVLATTAPSGAILRASWDGVPGHPVLFPAAVLPRLLELTGDAGARALLAHPTTEVVGVEAGDLADPTDVDTPEALEALSA